MPRSIGRYLAPVVISIAVLVTATSCTSDEPSAAVDPLDLSATVASEPIEIPGPTLPPTDLIAETTVTALIDDVSTTIGVVLPVGAEDCVAGVIADVVPIEELVEFGPNGILADAPENFQNRIFGAFDDCVDAATLAMAGGPILVAVGATDTKATCFFRLVRDELGMGGFYRYSAGVQGGIDADDRLTMIVAGILNRCQIDPATLGATTTTLPGATTTVAVATTEYVAPSTTRPIVSVVTLAPTVTLSTTTTVAQ